MGHSNLLAKMRTCEVEENCARVADESSLVENRERDDSSQNLVL